jgi:hypothetical protein
MGVSGFSKSEYTTQLPDVSKRIYTSLLLSKKSSFIFILGFTVVAVIDSNIVDFFSYSGVEASISVNTAIFVIFSIIFV